MPLTDPQIEARNNAQREALIHIALSHDTFTEIVSKYQAFQAGPDAFNDADVLIRWNGEDLTGQRIRLLVERINALKNLIPREHLERAVTAIEAEISG